MRYEIVDGVVLIYEGENEVPFIRQPAYPNGAPWGAGQAEAWAEQVILSLTDPTADLAGDSPDEPTKPRPVPEEVVEPEVEPEALPE